MQVVKKIYERKEIAIQKLIVCFKIPKKNLSTN